MAVKKKPTKKKTTKKKKDKYTDTVKKMIKEETDISKYY